MGDERDVTDGNWQRSQDCVSSPIEEALVILDINSGQYISLNETAAAVWELIEAPAGLGTIVDELRSRYEVEADRCRDAVMGILQNLESNGLAHRVA
jgi:hypothetical protein